MITKKFLVNTKSITNLVQFKWGRDVLGPSMITYQFYYVVYAIGAERSFRVELSVNLSDGFYCKTTKRSTEEYTWHQRQWSAFGAPSALHCLCLTLQAQWIYVTNYASALHNFQVFLPVDEKLAGGGGDKRTQRRFYSIWAMWRFISDTGTVKASVVSCVLTPFNYNFNHSCTHSTSSRSWQPDIW